MSSAIDKLIADEHLPPDYRKTVDAFWRGLSEEIAMRAMDGPVPVEPEVPTRRPLPLAARADVVPLRFAPAPGSHRAAPRPPVPAFGLVFAQAR